MNTGKRRKFLLVMVTGLAIAGVARTQTIALQLDGSNIGNDAIAGFPPQVLPGGDTGDGYHGVYQFTIQSGPDQGQTLWSTCLGPLGDTDYNTHSYTLTPFSPTYQGSYPAAWATPWAIQNAAYLWSQFSSAASGLSAAAFANGDLSPQDQGAALQMAMYVALYDSTGYGTYRETQFVPGANIGPQILGDINRDLSVLNPGVVNANSFIGDLLIPVNPGTDSQQDFIFLFPGQGLVVSVPEPVTISLMAGALGMLALAGDSLRGKFAVTVK